MSSSRMMNVDDPFRLLSPGVQKTIYDFGWSELRTVQADSIPLIILGDGDLLISAETASGKTEAVFLPLLSILEDRDSNSVDVLYISPMKALINDQNNRLNRLAEGSGVRVSMWHGDVAGSRKKRVVEEPRGILQITPESLESVLLNRSGDASRLFTGLLFIVIDELHTFVGSRRGVQLQSLLARVSRYSGRRPRKIGLSATVGDEMLYRRWLNYEDPAGIKAVNSKSNRSKVRYALFHGGVGTEYSGEAPGLDPKGFLTEYTRRLTRDHRALIFCNTKTGVEELSHSLNLTCLDEKCDPAYLVHHGALSLEERRYSEEALRHREAGEGPRSIVCTSSLELGIDVGMLDMIIQVDSTWSVSSLVQRLGRSGRVQGTERVCALFTTNDESLVQSMSVVELFLQGWLEPGIEVNKPYDILFHQIMASVSERGGIGPEDLVGDISRLGAFTSIDQESVEKLIVYMVENEYLQYNDSTGELLLGQNGEALVWNRDFYSVFDAVDGYTVVNGSKEIGSVPWNFKQRGSGGTFILAGKAWQIQEISKVSKRIYVQPAGNGALIRWKGEPYPPVDQRVPDMMLNILCSSRDYPYLKLGAAEALKRLRFQRAQNSLGPNDRAIYVAGNGRIVNFEAFAGTKVRDTLAAMVRRLTGNNMEPSLWYGLVCERWKGETSLEAALEMAATAGWKVEDLVSAYEDTELVETKFGRYLPPWALREMHGELFDIAETQEFLRNIKVKIRQLVQDKT